MKGESRMTDSGITQYRNSHSNGWLSFRLARSRRNAIQTALIGGPAAAAAFGLAKAIS
jgi:hypothetical protein